MNIMRSFTLRSLKRNKKRTVVTILGVVISVAMITAVAALLYSFMNYLQRGTVADGGEWHAKISNIQAKDLDTITQSDKVRTAVLSREVGFAQIPDSGSYSRQYLYLREYSANGFDQMSIRLTQGRLPQATGEVLISENILKGSRLDYAAGDTVTLDVGTLYNGYGERAKGNGYVSDAYDDDGNIIATPRLEPERSVTLIIVGVMEPPGFDKSWSAGYGILGYLDKASLAPIDRVDVYFTVSNVTRAVYNDIAALASQTGDDQIGVEFNDELLRYYGVVPWDNVYYFLQGFMLVLILIIVIASVSLIYNSFAMSVSERTRQLGLLASVGATRQQKRASVYFEGFFVGIIGIPLGILAGLGGIAVTLAAIQPLLDSFINMPAYVKLTLAVPPAAIIIAVLFSAVTIFVSVYRPARRASKIAPIDAIRMAQEVRLTRRSVKTSRLTRRIFGFEAEIALKNLKRSRKKYRATVVSLVISLVLFLTVSSYAMTTRTIEGAATDGYNFDIIVQYSGLSDAQREDLYHDIAALDTVDEFATASGITGFTIPDESRLSSLSKEYRSSVGAEADENIVISLVALDDASFASYAQTLGADAESFADTQHLSAILVNYGQAYVPAGKNSVKKIAGDVLNVGAGDTLTFTAGGAGDPKSESVDITLGAVTAERPMGVMTGGFAYVTAVTTKTVRDSIFGALSGEQKAQLGEAGYINEESYIKSENDQRLEAQIKELTQNMPESKCSIFNMKDMARSEQNLTTFLGVFVYGFITLISLICIANIFNTVSTNIGLRRRELAMLRSVGMTPKGFNRMMRFESIFYGLKSLLWGLPISLGVGYLLYRMQLNVLGGTFTLPWASYGVAILMILIIVLSSMMYSTHRIKKENIIDELKQETF